MFGNICVLCAHRDLENFPRWTIQVAGAVDNNGGYLNNPKKTLYVRLHTYQETLHWHIMKFDQNLIQVNVSAWQ